MEDFLRAMPRIGKHRFILTFIYRQFDYIFTLNYKGHAGCDGDQFVPPKGRIKFWEGAL